MNERWQNQEEAIDFIRSHSAVMLDFDMGTGKTRTVIDAMFELPGVRLVLVLCPKAVVPVWRTNLEKFAAGKEWDCWDLQSGTVARKAENLRGFLEASHVPPHFRRRFVVINYESAWRADLGKLLQTTVWDAVVLDESHRVKAAGSKISRFVAKLGRYTVRRLCLSGTPMAHSPLDVYGQYRFLDPTIFGTNYGNFLQQYAILGGPEKRFVVGYKNQQELMAKFRSIAVTCRMSDVRERLKLPEALPDVVHRVDLPPASRKILQGLERDMIAACEAGVVVANNVLVKLLRCLQVTSGFCTTVAAPGAPEEVTELNHAKAEMLASILEDVGPMPVVVFATFRHDLDTIRVEALKAGREAYELSGRVNELEAWQTAEGGAVLVVQIQAGAEGVDMTRANHAVYFSLPHSLALYNQSRARLYRPGQTRPVSFMHIIATGTVDEGVYRALERKEDIIEGIRAGTFDFGYMKK